MDYALDSDADRESSHLEKLTRGQRMTHTTMAAAWKYQRSDGFFMPTS